MKIPSCLLVALCAATVARGQQRLSPQQVHALLGGGGAVILVDLRSPAAYAKGTLPDALRMSVREALEKELAGTVVFFDDGLGLNLARRAAAEFTAAGKTAVELHGGFAAWRAAGLPTSEREGLTPRKERYVTYQDLTGPLLEDAGDIVLVDVRAPVGAGNDTPTPKRDGRDTLALPTAPPAPAELDLAAELPGYTVTRTPPAANLPAKAGAGAARPDGQPLYVLIDRGDGLAEQRAVELRAAGVARVAVLAGGETIIRRKGQSGLLRRGPGTGLATTGTPLQSNMATVVEEEVAP